MAYILKKAAGGGGGDATAANQTTQISLESAIYVQLGAIYGDTNFLVESIKTKASTSVNSFTSTTLSGVAALLQTFLQANPDLFIINISFSSGGVTQHDVLLTYNL